VHKNSALDQSAEGCSNTDVLTTRDGPRESSRSTGREELASRGGLHVISSEEGGTNKEGQTSKSGQSSKDGRASGVQFTQVNPDEAASIGSTPAQSLPGTNSDSSIVVPCPLGRLEKQDCTKT